MPTRASARARRRPSSSAALASQPTARRAPRWATMASLPRGTASAPRCLSSSNARTREEAVVKPMAMMLVTNRDALEPRRDDNIGSLGRRGVRVGSVSSRAARRAGVTAFMSRGRSPGSVASICWTSSSNSAGVSRRSSDNRGAWVVTRRANVAIPVGPTWGGRPATSSKRVAPSEYTSQRTSI